MASAFTHGFVALALGKTYTAEKMPIRFWALSVVCSILPDFDIIGFYLGIRYGDMFGHRGFFHSFTFAFILGVIVVLLAFRKVYQSSNSSMKSPSPLNSPPMKGGETRKGILQMKWWPLVGYFFAVTASHGLLDAMTTGGYGIGFFIPCDDTRYFLPWRPLQVSPIGIHPFWGRWGAKVIMSELVWIWIPVMLLNAGVSMYRRKRGRIASKNSFLNL